MTESVTVMDIPEEQTIGGLDSIQVFWRNFVPFKGQVTILCWGEAWTAYFGGMPEETIQGFFALADPGYLVNKLTGSQWQKRTKRHEDYLLRVVNRVKAALAA